MNNQMMIRVPVPAVEPRGSIAAGLLVAGLIRCAKWIGGIFGRGRRASRR